MADLTALQTSLAALVDQSITVTDGDTDWDLRLQYLNSAQREWAEVYPWKILIKESNSLTSLATSGGTATIAMPSTFRKLAGYPKIAESSTYAYPEIRPQEKDQYTSSDHYCYVLGNPSDSYYLIVHPALTASGASIYIPYVFTPADLSSATDVSPCANPEFLVQRAASLLWESREDARFPQAKAQADKILARMLEFETSFFDQAERRRVKTVEETRYSFKWGRN